MRNRIEEFNKLPNETQIPVAFWYICVTAAVIGFIFFLAVRLTPDVNKNSISSTDRSIHRAMHSCNKVSVEREAGHWGVYGSNCKGGK